VAFTLSATETKAMGALGYSVTYGDGTSDQIAVPEYCTTTPAPASQTWHLSHTYAHAGAYRVAAMVGANCTPDHATATLTVNA
jgi:hypothetical protein